MIITSWRPRTTGSTTQSEVMAGELGATNINARGQSPEGILKDKGFQEVV